VPEQDCENGEDRGYGIKGKKNGNLLYIASIASPRGENSKRSVAMVNATQGLEVKWALSSSLDTRAFIHPKNSTVYVREVNNNAHYKSRLQRRTTRICDGTIQLVQVQQSRMGWTY
jgi:hypothetical protein